MGDPRLEALLGQVDQTLAGLDQVTGDLGGLRDVLAKRLRDYRMGALPQVPWTRDLRPILPSNTHCPAPLQDGWWRRSLDQIESVCFHHTCSHSPEAFTAWYITKGGGRPGCCYTIWIAETGEILLCGDLEAGCWHNHNGHQNVDLSVGLAGNKSVYPPSPAQMRSAIQVAAWAILSPMLPGVTSLGQIMGHCDYPLCKPGQPHATSCPGWLVPQTGKWRSALFGGLAEFLADFLGSR